MKAITDYFAFRMMISTALVRVVYIMGAISILIGSVVVWGVVGDRDTPLIAFLAALLVVLAGSVLWRLFCEGTIILFRISDTLTSIDDGIQAGHATTVQAPPARSNG